MEQTAKRPTKCRPILFQAQMVRALLENRKSQTRRIMKPQPPEGDPPTAVEWFAPIAVDRHGEQYPGPDVFGVYGEEWHVKCPYGAPGDTLYVREAWRRTCDNEALAVIQYAADKSVKWMLCADNGEGDPVGIREHSDPFQCRDKDGPPWKPSIHMPKWASRITLEITDIGVERVTEISEEDAIAEGIRGENMLVGVRNYGSGPVEQWGDRYWFIDDPSEEDLYECPVEAYKSLWDSINGVGSFDSGPFVWCITFRRLAT